MKSKTKWIALALLILNSGCGIASQSKPASFCEIASPIYVEKDDDLTADTAKQILNHDCKGIKLCGWHYKHSNPCN